MNAAEKKIADFLDSVGIKYVYENPILIEQEFHNKKFLRIYYPDFFLSQYGIILEFWGMHEDQEYAKGMEKKKQDYYHNWIFVVNVYNLEGNWQEYVLKKIREVSEHRLMRVNVAIKKCEELYPHKEIEHKAGEHPHKARRRHSRGGRAHHRPVRHEHAQHPAAHPEHPRHPAAHQAHPEHVHRAITHKVEVHHVEHKAAPQAPPVLTTGPSKKIEIPHPAVHHAEQKKPEAEKPVKKKVVRPKKEEKPKKKVVKKKEEKKPEKKKGLLGSLFA
ncbi:MAG: hypothetical protein KJ574_03910 [Nanoarchaeota archaeon]|nr:hypothetical protein [Nanoarchaeota archaeon]